MIIDFREVHKELLSKWMRDGLSEKEQKIMNKLDEWYDISIHNNEEISD